MEPKELWDLYDVCRRPLGKTHVRGETLPEGAYHIAVHVWIKNGAGLYLMSRRSADRYSYPLKWECPGGSVTAGESSLEGALREVYEEVGIKLDPAKGRVFFSKVRPDFHDIMDVWVFDCEDDADLGAATTAEVCETAWMTAEQINELYRSGDYVPTLDYFFCAFGRPDPDYSGIIGMRVTGRTDRPLGSRHPRHPEMIYPVNYGYADGFIGGDGAPQDVYILGPTEPVDAFSGTVIAVIHRFNDCEDKWVVVPDDIAAEGDNIITFSDNIITFSDNIITFSDDDIIGQTAFQEQYFYAKLYR